MPKSPESPKHINREADALREKSKEDVIELLLKTRTELVELKMKNEQFEQSRAVLVQENWRLRFDTLTGLERGLVFYTKINNQIEQLIQNPKVSEILKQKTLTNSDIKKLGEIPLSATILDLGYLSKYNEDPEITQHYGGGHGAGDEILQQTGELIQTIDINTQQVKPKLKKETGGFRLGGDEFGMLHLLTKDEAKKIAQEFKMKHSEIKIKGADLPPTINEGTAGFFEAAEVFIKAIPYEERLAMDDEAASKTLQKFLSNIAERRVKRAKAYERILMMTELLEKDPEVFHKNFSYLQKGALRLGLADFETLIKIKNKSIQEFAEKIREKISLALDSRHQAELTRAVQEYQAIVEVADREALE